MVRVDPAVYLFSALLILTLPVDWLFFALLAGAFHEVCHIVFLRLLGGKVYGIRIGVGGAVIETELDAPVREFLCAFAGPLGSFLLFATYRYCPKLAVCAGVQGLFNLLPMYPMDGGRMLQCLLKRICPKSADRILFGVECVVILSIAALSVVGVIRFSLGIMPVMLSITLILRMILRKRPCKQGRNRVQ